MVSTCLFFNSVHIYIYIYRMYMCAPMRTIYNVGSCRCEYLFIHSNTHAHCTSARETRSQRPTFHRESQCIWKTCGNRAGHRPWLDATHTHTHTHTPGEKRKCDKCRSVCAPCYLCASNVANHNTLHQWCMHASRMMQENALVCTVYICNILERLRLLSACFVCVLHPLGWWCAGLIIWMVHLMSFI